MGTLMDEVAMGGQRDRLFTFSTRPVFTLFVWLINVGVGNSLMGKWSRGVGPATPLSLVNRRCVRNYGGLMGLIWVFFLVWFVWVWCGNFVYFILCDVCVIAFNEKRKKCCGFCEIWTTFDICIRMFFFLLATRRFSSFEMSFFMIYKAESYVYDPQCPF